MNTMNNIRLPLSFVLPILKKKEKESKQERKKEKGKKFSVTLLLLHAILTTLRIYRTGHLFYVLEINTCNKVISRLLTYLYDMKKPIYSAAVI